MGRLTSDLISNVGTARRAVGLTQAELALAADVSRQTVSAIEQGDYNPSTSLSLRLASVLEVPVEALFSLPPGAVEELELRREKVLPNAERGSRR